jgi:hypothetical protein
MKVHAERQAMMVGRIRMTVMAVQLAYHVVQVGNLQVKFVGLTGIMALTLAPGIRRPG